MADAIMELKQQERRMLMVLPALCPAIKIYSGSIIFQEFI
ncbi:hypothetical protein IMSAGC013_04498 [Lachnospiraceae bacterium]|jgi:hypothetical protein|nr:hypothetical protein IMSAGC013_04498 [Lachnospiraceae bacterium]